MSDVSLNPAQRAAVEHGTGPALVIAGAGSGKTRVLTSRVAKLLERGVPPEGVLAFTFTNRAAREMRHRIEAQLGSVAEKVWLGTFHATAVRILRRETRTLGLPPGFSIYDRDDQESIVRELVREASLPEAAYRTGMLLARFSEAKSALVPPAELEQHAHTEFERQIALLYARYQAALARAGALDFDDLIGETVRLWLDHPEAGARWSRRFEHVLVDEYQDTNHAQFRLVQCLGGAHGNVFVVGDDDQSIYGWRGADVRNMLDFERAFPGAVTIRLEQNYRSTGNILDAANAVIAHNVARKGKTLWSERGAGPPLVFALLPDEIHEARRLRRWLERAVAKGRRLTDCAILYRTNSQSRAIESELRQAGIAYEIVGGVSFFQRREVKDVLAYLRLAVNPLDTASFFRIWNTPRRGLGAVVEAQVRSRLERPGAEPLAILRELLAEGALRGVARTGAASLLALMDDLAGGRERPVDELFAMLLERSGYLEHLDAASESEAQDRRANVEELGVAATVFAAAAAGEPGGNHLLAWLSECALLTDADRVQGGDRVLMLTMHNAKGLEFDAVAVAGLEEGLLPHGTALESTDELEEERRLFYVALTRARDEVLLTAAAYRRRFDGARGSAPSRFVSEIPRPLLQREETAGGWSDRADERRAPRGERWIAGHAARGRDAISTSEDDVRRDVPGDSEEFHSIAIPLRPGGGSAQSRRAVGRRVVHETFGPGKVLAAEGEGPNMKLTVQFTGTVKKVYARFVTAAGDGD